MKRYVSIIGIIFLFVILAMGMVLNRTEPFVVASNDDIPQVNEGSEPWKHHEINSIGYLQLRPAFQRGIRHHMNASYFEVDNYTFDMALQNTFRNTCQKTTYRDSDWLQEIQPEMFNVSPTLLKAYNDVITYVKDTVNASPMFKDNTKEPIQIVHDRWISFRNHRTSKTKTLLRIEMIFYRSGKFQGKHVTMGIIVDTSMKENIDRYTVIQTKVEGVVPEDAIGMFPVVATQDGTKADGTYMNVPADPLENYPSVLLDKDTIDKTIKTQNDKLNRNLAAQLLVIG